MTQWRYGGRHQVEKNGPNRPPGRCNALLGVRVRGAWQKERSREGRPSEQRGASITMQTHSLGSHPGMSPLQEIQDTGASVDVGGSIGTHVNA